MSPPEGKHHGRGGSHPGCRCRQQGNENGRSDSGDANGLPRGWRPRPQGTWLLIRYDETDGGARPVPNGEVFWESPDIRVVGGDAWGNPTAGTPVTLEARVWNQGDLDAAPVRVDFSFIAPALGIMPGAPQPIGTAWTTLLAGHSRVVTCPEPWTPPEYPTNLHACIIVTCSAPGQHDIPTAPADARLDRHVAQRNLSVIEGSAGEVITLQLVAANLFERRAEISIVGAATWLTDERMPRGPLLMPTLATLGTSRAAARATDLDQARLWLKRAARLDAQARSAPRPGAVENVGEIARVTSLRASKPTPAPTAIASRPALAPHPDFASLKREVHLGPGQNAIVEVEIQVPRDRQGPWLVVYLAQSQSAQLTGGYTVLINSGA